MINSVYFIIVNKHQVLVRELDLHVQTKSKKYVVILQSPKETVTRQTYFYHIIEFSIFPHRPLALRWYLKNRSKQNHVMSNFYAKDCLRLKKNSFDHFVLQCCTASIYST